MFITGSLFYIYAALTIFSAIMVISVKNPVHSVLFLILSFFTSAGLFVLIGAEFIAMTLVIVYVGAVAVLFLFVVMMLDINLVKIREGFFTYLPLCIVVAIVLVGDLIFMLYSSLRTPSIRVDAQSAMPDATQVTNTHAIGRVLYTDYVYAFQIAGLILLLAMIGSIVLTLRTRPGVRKQNISKQLARSKKDGLKIVKVKSGVGIDGNIY